MEEEKVSVKSSLASPKNIAGLAVIALVLAFGLWRINTPKVTAPVEQPVVTRGDQSLAMPESTPEAGVETVSYQGVEGQTALELLKASHEVEVQSFGDLGEFVNSIDGVAGDADHYWSFYLNGEPATVGAGTYATKPGDVIEWKFEEIK